MNFTAVKRLSMFLAALFLFTTATGGVPVSGHSGPSLAAPQSTLPNPILFFAGQEFYSTGGKQFVRYRFNVANADAYPNELFAAAPELPPCGKNTKASRTWVDIYDQGGKKLNSFCAFGKSANLNEIWFSLEPSVVPPSWVYIELNDRKTNTKYKSNLADTTM